MRFAYLFKTEGLLADFYGPRREDDHQNGEGKGRMQKWHLLHERERSPKKWVPSKWERGAYEEGKNRWYISRDRSFFCHPPPLRANIIVNASQPSKKRPSSTPRVPPNYREQKASKMLPPVPAFSSTMTTRIILQKLTITLWLTLFFSRHCQRGAVFEKCISKWARATILHFVTPAANDALFGWIISENKPMRKMLAALP